MSSRATYTVFFEPNDVVLFRDHRPFDMGAHAVATGRFPPPPSVFGCLRTALLRTMDRRFFDRPRSAREVARALADVRPRIRGPVAARPQHLEKRRGEPDEWVAVAPSSASISTDRIEPLMTVPLDVAGLGPAVDANQLRRVRSVLQPPASGRFLDRARLLGSPASKDAPGHESFPIRVGEPPKRGPRRLMTAAGIDWWRSPSAAGDDLTVDQTEAFDQEDRVGIARDRARLAHMDGMFYIARYTRMAPHHGYAVELTVEAPASDLVRRLEGSFVRLGGKGRTARLYVTEGSCLPERWCQIPGRRARVTLLTPAKANVLVRHGDSDRLVLGGGSSARVVSLMTDTGETPAGGWDFARRAPKPLQPVFPAGTVFFCEFDSDLPTEKLRSVGEVPADGDVDPSDRCAGFGAVVCGEW